MAELTKLDHVEIAKEESLFQFEEKPVIQGILKSWNTCIQDLEDVIYDLYEINIYNAEGEQLDQLYGELFGIERKGRTDDTYRASILSKISTFGSDGTVENLQKNLESITSSENVVIFEHYPADVHAHIGGTFSGYTYVEANDLTLAGVGIRLIIDNNFDSLVPSELFEVATVIQANVYGVPHDVQAEYLTVANELLANIPDLEASSVELSLLAEIGDTDFIPLAELLYSDSQIPDPSVIVPGTLSITLGNTVPTFSGVQALFGALVTPTASVAETMSIVLNVYPD